MMKDTREPAADEQQEEAKEQRRQMNPRLVFNDPDAFFSDLLLEQQEQG